MWQEKSSSRAQLETEIAHLRERVAALEREKAELSLLLDLTTQHSDGITEDLHQQVEQDREHFTRLLSTAAHVAHQANTILDSQQLLDTVVQLIEERFSLYAVRIYLLDPENQKLVQSAYTREIAPVTSYPRHQTVDLGDPGNPLARAARSQEIVLVDSPLGFDTCLPATLAALAVPLIAGGVLLGVLDVQSSDKRAFDYAYEDVYSTMAAQIATALQNARLFEQVQKAAEHLRELDRLKSEFLATVSHELQTPLNAILGYTQLLLMEVDGPLNDEIKKDVTLIQENGNHLLRLVSDILDLTKIEASQLSLTRERIEVAPFLAQVKANTENYFYISRVEFAVGVKEAGLWVEADPARLRQILTNLISNAAKFTEKGHVHVYAYRREDRICIAVEDTGIGIAEKDREKIFKCFGQVDGSLARRAEGLGLGLAITRRLVHMQDGILELESELGRGSTFTVCLPFPPALKGA
ncbi:MAG: ATP-binding protein [Candidatus Micrarchaeota archaeon]